jgi:hypothetical protein
MLGAMTMIERLSDAPLITGMPAFLVEVAGTWVEPIAGTETPEQELIRIAAPGPAAAEMAAVQVFRGTATRRRRILGEPRARALTNA